MTFEARRVYDKQKYIFYWAVKLIQIYFNCLYFVCKCECKIWLFFCLTVGKDDKGNILIWKQNAFFLITTLMLARYALMLSVYLSVCLFVQHVLNFIQAHGIWFSYYRIEKNVLYIFLTKKYFEKNVFKSLTLSSDLETWYILKLRFSLVVIFVKTKITFLYYLSFVEHHLFICVFFGFCS